MDFGDLGDNYLLTIEKITIVLEMLCRFLQILAHCCLHNVVGPREHMISQLDIHK